MSSTRETKLLALALVSLAATACRRAPAPALPPVLDEIQVRIREITPPTIAAPSAEEISRIARTAVEAVPGPLRYDAAAPPQAPRARMQVQLALAWRAGEKGGSLVAQVSAKIEPRGDAALMRVVREAEVEKEGLAAQPGAAELRAHLARALDLTAGAAMRAEQLWLGPPAPIRAAIGGPDEDLRDDAIRFCAERKDREAVPQLIELLKRDDVELRDRAIGALAEIGDARAVRPLGELAKFGDLNELPKIIDAISRVGGAEASAYLEFVAGSHPDPEMRAVAKRALEHMKARPAAKDAAP